MCFQISRSHYKLDLSIMFIKHIKSLRHVEFFRRDVENYQQIGYQDDEHADDLERLQGRLITEDAMNMMDHDKGTILGRVFILLNLLLYCHLINFC